MLVNPNLNYQAYAALAYPKQVTIATGPEQGLYKPLSENLANSIRNQIHLSDVPLLQTEGSYDNLRRLQSGEADFALYQAGTLDELQDVVMVDVDSDVVERKVQFVANLYSQPTHFIVRRDAGIAETADGDVDPADLRGRRVQLGLENSGDYAMSLILLRHFGVDEGAVDARHLQYEDVKQAFQDDELDAAFITIGVQAPIFKELFDSGKCELRSIPFAEALAEKHVSLSPYKIPKGMYSTQPQIAPASDVETVSLSAQLLTHEDVHAGLVSEVTRLVLSEDFLKENQLRELFLKGRAYAQEKPEFAIHQGARSVYDPDFDIHIFESLDAIYSLFASILIATFLFVRSMWQRQERKKEHKLDRYMRSVLDIERRQVSLDSDADANDEAALQKLLDEVTFLRQEALHDLAAHELNEDRAVDSLIQMCHDLTNKINAKISRQRLDRRLCLLAEAFDKAGAGASDDDTE